MSTDYAQSQPDDIQRAKEIIATILARRPGEDAAISSQELADRTPVKSTTVRDLIPKIVREHRIPVGSCRHGYYRIETHEEFVAEMETYESQRKAATDRMERLSQAYYGGRGDR